jgi:glycosyltransferase involved in cell wall biosynthesis
MHVLFVHKNFPAQFGHIARHLVRRRGYRCTFISEKPEGRIAGVRRLQYEVPGCAQSATNYCSRTFENQMWASQGLVECLRQQHDIAPDLIVAHSGFVSAIFLRELYDCPTINYFEYFYRTAGGDMDFRRDLPECSLLDRVRARARNATMLLDLENCDAGYSPTRWQRSRLPKAFQSKIVTIFDGMETDVWRRLDASNEPIPGVEIPPDVKVVTYVSRGLESMRGFDIFMRMAKRLCQSRKDVLFLVVGQDQVVYGGDRRFTGRKTFKQWVLDQDEYDLSRIRFLGRVPTKTLVRIFSRSDLHIYLTVPFVLSWSLMNALSCGAVVLGSDTAPVQEMIQHRQNGLLCEFFDVDGFVERADEVLSDPGEFRPLGNAAAEIIRQRYDIDVCLPKMLKFYERVRQQWGTPRKSVADQLE